MGPEALVVQGDARSVPLPDASVDLVVTSPPYWTLRSYTDDDGHYGTQIGSEGDWRDYLTALVAATAEIVRVLKPHGSAFVNLGDKYASNRRGPEVGSSWLSSGSQHRNTAAPWRVHGVPRKSLVLLPERYRVACVDVLGLVARAVLVWDKVSPMPDRVDDRVRRSHEDWVHLTRSGDYFHDHAEVRDRTPGGGLGAMPGSVWRVAPEPFRPPPGFAQPHAAFPTDPIRRLILGWSPPGICVACGEGRRTAVESRRLLDGEPWRGGTWDTGARPSMSAQGVGNWRFSTDRRPVGQVCSCTPHHDVRVVVPVHDPHGTLAADGVCGGTSTDASDPRLWDEGRRTPPCDDPSHFTALAAVERRWLPDGWAAPPTRPAVVLDPFAGSGTVPAVARALGRTGVGIDGSHAYCRLGAWRAEDPSIARKVRQRTASERQHSLF